MTRIKWQCPSDPPSDPSYQKIMDKLWSEIGITSSNAGDLTSLAYWTFAECKLIALGIAPNLLGKRVLKRVVTVLKLERAYSKLHEPFKRAYQVGEVADQMNPHYFLNWATKNGIAIPEPILSATARDTKEAASAQKNDTATAATKTPKSNPAAQKRADASLYKLIYGMAKAKYRFDRPGFSHNAVSAILNDLQLHGIKMSENTIRSHLQKSQEAYEDSKE